MSRALPVLALVCGLSMALQATTAVEPPFDQLVAQADAIFEGVVVNVDSTLRSDTAGRSIVTAVSFEVRRALKGTLPRVLTLDFLGGTVGDLSLHVAEMPQFARGDEDVLFVRTQGRYVSPIVGFMHGRFRIVRTPASTEIRRFDRSILGSVARLGRSAAAPQPGDRALSLDDFESAIAVEVGRQRGAAR